MANVIGADVSFYQDDPQTPQGIDFAKMRANAGYVIIRGGQNLWADTDFKVNWREAKLAGIPRGSYWFYDSRIDPKKQAELWISLFNGDFGELPLFADFEDNYGGSFKGWKHWQTFIERIKDLTPGKEISIYTGYYYWRENTVLIGIPAASLESFKQYPLWIANYGVTKPLIPKPWTDWTFWQFTEKGDGRIYGVESGNIDLNYFNGDLNAFHARFGITPTPIPEPIPGDKLFRVTASSLVVREGPGLTYKQVGGVFYNDIVEEIGANSDRTWLNIRKLDGSNVGWSFSAFLQKISMPAPEPTPTPTPTPAHPPDADDENLYRVIATSLRVREAPGLEHDSIGLVYLGEIVEKIDANSDGSWLKIQRLDGSLVGWSFGFYLQRINAPLPSEPAPTTPIPEHTDKNWYRVNTVTLAIKETANTTSKTIGTVLKNDTVPALDDSSDPNWIQIQRLDGLTGWCEKKLVVFLENTRPASIRQSLFPGITYIRKDLTSPRPVVVHVMAIDLQTPKLEFLVTPSANSTNVLCSRTTSKFLDEFKLQVAVNGGYYSYLDATYDPVSYCPNGGDPLRVSDYAASRGKIYSPKKTAQPIIYIKPRNQVTFNVVEGRVFNAISGDRMVVADGKVVKNLADATPNPRTAISLSKNVRTLSLMVVDGRQPGYSEGVTVAELADLLISSGAHTAANMDGGGSSTMVIRGSDGNVRIMNSPVESDQPGTERAIANHLGLYLTP